MIERYGVSNFKAIRNEVAFDLRPITLLFGPNSSGKSSVLQSMCVLREMLDKGSIDVHRVNESVARMDVGGFDHFVHKGDIARGVTWTITTNSEDDEERDPRNLLPWEVFDVRRVYTIRAYRDTPEEFPDVEPIPKIEMHMSISGEEFSTSVQVSSERPSGHRGITNLNPDHPVLADFVRRLLNSSEYRYEVVDKELLQRPAIWAITEIARTNSPFTQWSRNQRQSSIFANVRDSLGTAHLEDGVAIPLMILAALDEGGAVTDAAQDFLEVFDDFDQFNIASTMLATREVREELGGYGEDAQKWEAKGLEDKHGSLDALGEQFRTIYSYLDRSSWIVRFIDDAVKRISKLFSEPYDSILYLQHTGPLRYVPGRHETLSSLSKTIETSEWLRLTSNLETRGLMNEWLGEERLGTSLRVEPVSVYSESEVNQAFDAVMNTEATADLRVAFQEELHSKASMGVRSQLIDTRTGVTVGLSDVGVGIGQVLPVLSRAVGNRYGLELIEQPELHLHPALQAELADAFIFGHFWRDNQFVLETHSEHLVLRLLRRVRETTQSRNPEKLELKASDLSIVYVDRDNYGSTNAYEIEVSEDGAFLDEWPNGFFPERLEEIER